MEKHRERYRSGAARRAENDAHSAAQAAMAGFVRFRAAAVQPTPPGGSARLPHPGTGVGGPEARDDQAPQGARRGPGWRRPLATATTFGRPADRRYPADPGMAGRRALRHGP